MTALIVIGAIALFIFILLASSIRVDMEYSTVFKYRVKYLFFTVISDPESPRQIKKRQKKKLKAKKRREKETGKADTQLVKADENKQSTDEASPSEKTEPAKAKQEKSKAEKSKMKFSADLIRRIVGRASPHVKRIFKKIRLSNVLVDITAGGDDAAKAAISYGIHCSAVHGLVAFLDSVISFQTDGISVRADFDLPKTEYYLKGTLKLRLSTLLHSGIWGFFAVLSEIRKDSIAAAKTTPEQEKAA